jgi:hypothetical protein
MPFESRAAGFEVDLTYEFTDKSIVLTVQRAINTRLGFSADELTVRVPRQEGHRVALFSIRDVAMWVDVVAVQPNETAFVIGFVDNRGRTRDRSQ